MKKFLFHNIIYKTKNYFEGVCLELDIVVDGSTTQEVKTALDELILGHMGVAAEAGFPRDLIDRPAPKRYWDKYKRILAGMQKKVKESRPSYVSSELVSYDRASNEVAFAYV